MDIRKSTTLGGNLAMLPHRVLSAGHYGCNHAGAWYWTNASSDYQGMNRFGYNRGSFGSPIKEPS
jgi:hypothetical protein